MLKRIIIGRWVNVLLGAWLFVSAPFLSRSNGELASNLVLGLAVFLAAFLAMGTPRASRVNLLLGCCAVATPFVLAFRDRLAGLNDIVVGILVVSAALWARHQSQQRHEHAQA